MGKDKKSKLNYNKQSMPRPRLSWGNQPGGNLRRRSVVHTARRVVSRICVTECFGSGRNFGCARIRAHRNWCNFDVGPVGCFSDLRAVQRVGVMSVNTFMTLTSALWRGSARPLTIMKWLSRNFRGAYTIRISAEHENWSIARGAGGGKVVKIGDFGPPEGGLKSATFATPPRRVF